MDNAKTALGQTMPFVLFCFCFCFCLFSFFVFVFFVLLLHTRLYMICFNLDNVSMML